jgi:cytochrome P450
MNTLRPILDGRINDLVHITDHGIRSDAIQWMTELFPTAAADRNTDRMTRELLATLWAASSAPGGMVTEIVWQLLLHEEYAEALRREASKTVLQYGWTEKTLNSLPLLDSFIRETNRLFPTGSSTIYDTDLAYLIQLY